MIDRAGLEIRYTLMGIGGLNPSLSATGNPIGSLFCAIASTSRAREGRPPATCSKQFEESRVRNFSGKPSRKKISREKFFWEAFP